MRLACRTDIGPLNIGETARVLTADVFEDFAERTDLAGLHALPRAIGLGEHRPGRG
jgi:hypothetical protein